MEMDGYGSDYVPPFPLFTFYRNSQTNLIFLFALPLTCDSSLLARYIVSPTIAVLAFVMRWVADSMCLSWSQACWAGSDLFSHICAVVVLFMVIVGSTKAKELRDFVKKKKAVYDAVFGGDSAKQNE